ncbi:MAG: cobyric acid synthase, partial [Alphaproteobacteria bacterium]|nr:cobyric acid synthase [Alphaproteobacteria bacterium]
MLQGTGSDVGKSLLAAGLCRAYARRGVSVRPFKPQNMSNNAAVTADGGEIGRAQALQARACGLKPTIDMNPVLLKPQSEIGAQVVVQGRVVGNAKAAEYHALKPTLMARVLESFERLAGRAELVIVEGAGSASEVNLRAADIANMGFAEAADVPVALVADIDRGGVIASIVGTVALLPEAERARLKGYIVNRFRGDVALFDSAIDILRDRTGLDSFGVVPFFAEAAKLPAEDGMAVDRYATGLSDDRPIRIAVLALPRISNFDDLDPLRAEPDVAVTMVRRGEAIPGDCDLVILPGSKATLADLQALREAGWDVDIAAHLRRGGQMLGRTLADPNGIEGPPATVDGLGLLDIETVLTGDKQLVEVGATCLLDQQIVRGYEMHVGQTTGPGTSTPMLRLDDGRPDGAVSSDGKAMGCYVHGLFATDDFRHAFLHRLKARADSGVAYEAQIEATLDALADHLEASL